MHPGLSKEYESVVKHTFFLFLVQLQIDILVPFFSLFPMKMYNFHLRIPQNEHDDQLSPIY